MTLMIFWQRQVQLTLDNLKQDKPVKLRYRWSQRQYTVIIYDLRDVYYLKWNTKVLELPV